MSFKKKNMKSQFKLINKFSIDFFKITPFKRIANKNDC